MSERLEAAQALGRTAGSGGQPLSACPFEWRALEAVWWERGWRGEVELGLALLPDAEVLACIRAGRARRSAPTTELNPEG